MKAIYRPEYIQSVSLRCVTGDRRSEKDLRCYWAETWRSSNLDAYGMFEIGR